MSGDVSSALMNEVIKEYEEMKKQNEELNRKNKEQIKSVVLTNSLRGLGLLCSILHDMAAATDRRV